MRCWRRASARASSRERWAATRATTPATASADLPRAQGHPARGPEHQRAGAARIDGRTTRHPGYAVSQRIRKRVEEIFGWMKTVGRLPPHALSRPGPHRDWLGYLVATAYNLVRIARLSPAPA